jgi:hypothetical protein
MSKKQNSKSNNQRNRNPKEEGQNTTSHRSSVFEALKFDASNIYFSNLVGTEISRVTSASLKFLPGFIRYNSMANFVTRSDMINVAATSIYTFVRHANAGKTNYESSDLMLYLIAMSEIYVGIQELIRAYGLASYFRSRNLYSGHILRALGFEDSLRDNLANARYSINTLINKTKAFAVPRTFSYFEERLSEYANVYSDEDSDMGQILFNVPTVLYEFDPYTEETGGKLKPKMWAGDHGGYFNFETRVAALNQMLDKLRRNEDINIMSGDILKAYGDNLFHLGPIPIDYAQTPVYDILQLHQYQNAHVAPYLIPGDLLQVNNTLKTTLKIDSDANNNFRIGTGEYRMLNSAAEDIDANLIFALSKYQVVSTGAGTENSPRRIDSANTTILYCPEILYFDTSNSSLCQKIVVQWNTDAVDYSTISLLSKFKYPTYIYGMSQGLPIIGDMHYVAKLSKEDTHRMNDARFILAFQTPQMG